MNKFKGAGWRKIVVNAQEYRWRYGHGVIKVRRFADGKTVAITKTAQLLGLSEYEHEKGIHKRWACVTPGHIRDLILAQVSP